MPSFEAGASGSSTVLSSARLVFAQKAFIVAGGRLLMVRKSAGDPYHPGRWEVPGGRLEDADLDLDDHIRREVWEEVGLKIDPGAPFHLWQWHMPDQRARAAGRPDGQVRVVAAARRCRALSTDARLDHQEEGDHLDACRWVPLDEVEDRELIPSLRPVVRAFLSPGG